MTDHSLFFALQEIYGDGAVEQHQRYQQAIDHFRQLYGATGQVALFRAPGRVNLIGEHTDYNHGFVMPAALDKDVLLLARPRRDGMIHLANIEPAFVPASFALGPQIPSAPSGDWSNYVRGAAQMLSQQLGAQAAGMDAVGMDALVVGDAPYGVPKGAGVSSSTAFSVVAAVALAHFAGWHPPAAQMAHLCSDAEWYVGTRGGMMDQFAALLGQRDHALFLDCRPEVTGHYDYAQIPLPATHRLLVVDSGVHHGNVRGEFNQRVAAGRAGVALLQRHFPTHFGQPAKLRAVQEVAWAELAPHLPEQMTVGEVWQQGLDLGDIPGLHAEMSLRVLACCRHVWTENARVLQAVAAMRAGDVALLGQLMNAAHASARDDYQISCPELELLVNAAHQVRGVAGARLTGAGWGGCIIALVAAEAVTEFTSHIEQSYHAQTGRTAAIFPCRAGSGAGLVAQIG